MPPFSSSPAASSPITPGSAWRARSPAEAQLGARPLAGPPTSFAYRQFLVVRPELPAVHRAAYDELLAAIADAERALQSQPAAAAALLAADAHVDAQILARALARGRFGVQPMTDAVWREQQELADLFAAIGLVKKIPDVRAAALGPIAMEATRP